MPGQPDPSEVDVSGRGETQPEDEQAAERFAEQTDRHERRNAPSGDAAAMRGPADHDDSDHDSNNHERRPQPERPRPS